MSAAKVSGVTSNYFYDAFGQRLIDLIDLCLNALDDLLCVLVDPLQDYAGDDLAFPHDRRVLADWKRAVQTGSLINTHDPV